MSFMDNSMSYQELKRERDALQVRIKQLEDEILSLRERLLQYEPLRSDHEKPTPPPAMTRLSVSEKVALFRSLFRGREDVFARRWQNCSNGKSGYQPVCENEWNPQLCNKRQYKCSECPNRQFSRLTDNDIYRHLEGKAPDCRDVIGLYAINEDNTCHLLCADFDDKNCEHGYKGDVLTFVNVCKSWNIPSYVERSRSGNGAHVWIFFDAPISAAKARRLGYAILTEATNRDGCISFRSYDRFFPNQDYLPQGGLGNLVALPLQGQARKQGNSVFVNEHFEPYPDQWEYLLNIKRLTEADVDILLHSKASAQPLGALATTSENNPWEAPEAPTIDKRDFAAMLAIVKANMLYLPIGALSAKIINHFKRIASFRNPEFYSRQAMRLTTYNIPRIISCAEIIDDYLALPRGCEDAVIQFLEENKANYEIIDKTNHGKSIHVTFTEELRSEQAKAVTLLCENTNGVLSATTAFGKTVAAIGLIARHGVNTLILTHTKALLEQWKKELGKFLSIKYIPKETKPKCGRPKKSSPIGTLSSTGNSLHGFIDIALIQSCITNGEVKPFVKEYGLVIVDECHHVSAVNFEHVLKETNAHRVYGLTATPIRKDGHQPIIFMQCGPIRYTADAKHQMQMQSFSRLLVPRFTHYHDVIDKNLPYMQIIHQLAEDEYRNRLIVDDVCTALKEGRTPLVLSSLTTHVDSLANLLKHHCANVIVLIGSESTKEKRLKMERLNQLSDNDPLVIIATGKYIGEGFDCPRLDTLFLALPVSWKGIIAQYAGRLHRDHVGKQEVRIYDYIDFNIPVCEAMYRRRLKGYASIGYSLMPDGLFADIQEPENQFFNGSNFITHYISSLGSAKSSIIIICPKVKFSHRSLVATRLADLIPKGIKIAVATREKNEYTEHLEKYGIRIIIKVSLSFSATIIDRSRLWYGNVNPLGFYKQDDNIITFRHPEVATTLIDLLSSI